MAEPRPGPVAQFREPNPNNTLTAEQHSASDSSSDPGGGGGGEEAACLVCTRVARRRARLPCGHTWCRRCLRVAVRTAVRAPEGGWPPRCCGDRYGEITEDVVQWLMDFPVIHAYRERLEEVGVNPRERVYCYVITCGAFIHPEHYRNMGNGVRGGLVAICPTCQRSTCAECGTEAHTGTACPEDPDLEAVMQTIEAHGYQFCARCNAVVERHAGCNHMTCLCGYQFCYLCGTRWGGCHCVVQGGGVRIPRADRPRLEAAVRTAVDAGARLLPRGATPRPPPNMHRAPTWAELGFPYGLQEDLPENEDLRRTHQAMMNEDAEARIQLEWATDREGHVPQAPEVRAIERPEGPPVPPPGVVRAPRWAELGFPYGRMEDTLENRDWRLNEQRLQEEARVRREQADRDRRRTREMGGLDGAPPAAAPLAGGGLENQMAAGLNIGGRPLQPQGDHPLQRRGGAPLQQTAGHRLDPRYLLNRQVGNDAFAPPPRAGLSLQNLYQEAALRRAMALAAQQSTVQGGLVWRRGGRSHYEYTIGGGGPSGGQGQYEAVHPNLVYQRGGRSRYEFSFRGENDGQGAYGGYGGGGGGRGSGWNRRQSMYYGRGGQQGGYGGYYPYGSGRR